FTRYRSGAPDRTKLPATAVTVVAETADAARAINRAQLVAGAVHAVRDLVNTPPSDLYPETFAEAAASLADGAPVTIDVLGDAELRAGGFGGILGVGQGSTRGPRLVK